MLAPREFDDVLKRHVLEVWFPRSLDREFGGFLCDFDRQWHWCGPHDKLLEFQARQTLMAADAARRFPHERSLRDAAVHGFTFLRDVLWDREYGGWFHKLDRSGKPLEHHTKHSHGFAYALTACASVFELTGDETARQLASDGLAWLDRFARDPEHGGYFGLLSRDGARITSPAKSPEHSLLDSLGTELDLKDLNVHSDLLEAFALMYRSWPGPLLRDRLAEAVSIVAERMVNPATGATHFFVTPDWRPVPHLVRVGYQAHSAYRLTLCLGATGQDDLIRCMAVRMMDCAIRRARHSEGDGYYYAVTGTLPALLHDHSITVRRRTWWVQMEVLKALLAVSRLVAAPEPYVRMFEEQWRYVRKHLIDERFGGIYMHGLDNARVWHRKFGARMAPPHLTRKGDIWKDASHDGRALLFISQTLGA